ncbi:hypothetical protein DGG96_11920 [Legionella qingyii]|uniref:Uncharacterized protein n=1 Tax=Legionella qingyii TaxID=2184757 RepID=A0A317U296_9GAMM|nr:hypothetical protein DGG96_11920 [Legionella qingyii]
MDRFVPVNLLPVKERYLSITEEVKAQAKNFLRGRVGPVMFFCSMLSPVPLGADVAIKGVSADS